MDFMLECNNINCDFMFKSPANGKWQFEEIVSIVSLVIAAITSFFMGWVAWKTKEVAKASAEISKEALRTGREQVVSQRRTESMLLAQHDIENASAYRRNFSSKSDDLIQTLLTIKPKLTAADVKIASEANERAGRGAINTANYAIEHATRLIKIADSIDSLDLAKEYIDERSEYLMKVIMQRELVYADYEKAQRVISMYAGK